MKRPTDTTPSQPNRRALIQHQHTLLRDPQVVAFLDRKLPDPLPYKELSGKLVRANEPALLLDLIQHTQNKRLLLCATDDTGNDVLPLPDGLLAFFAQRINQAPSVTNFVVAEAVLTPAICTLLQVTLNDPGCALTSLEFAECTFADAQVRFPTSAPTVESFDWSDELAVAPAVAPMDRVLPTLTGWPRLKHLCLMSPEVPLNFDLITRLVLANRCINSLYLECEVAPAAPGNVEHLPHQDPGLLFDVLATDRTGLTKLTLKITDANDENFNDHCLQRMAHCLLTNTTLELLSVPGIQMCSTGMQQEFTDHLYGNRSLIELGPLDFFGGQTPAPVRKNRQQRYWFTTEFVLGAAQALMRLLGAYKDQGTKVAGYLASTPVELTYCGAAMALICKATHAEAVKLRSAGLREAIKIHMKTNDLERCLYLVQGLVEFHIDLLPADKQAVVAFARERDLMNFLPAGYAH